MDISFSFVPFLFVLLVWGIHCDDDKVYDTFYMDSLCDINGKGSIDMYRYSAIKVRLTARSNYPANMDCMLTIQAKTTHHLIMKFLKLGINRELTCTGLTVYSGIPPSSYILGGPYCTHYSSPKNIKALTSGASSLTLHFKSLEHTGASYGFEIVVTAIKLGYKCESDEFTCSKDNEPVTRCIASSRTCDGYDNCGNMADENYATAYCGGLNPGQIAAVVVGCVALVAIIVVVVVCVKKRR